MKKLSIVILLLSAFSAFSQDLKIKETTLDFYGFVRNEFYLDSYKGLDIAHEQFYLIPLYTGKDANGEDINQQTSANMAAIATRIGVRVKGPEIFGATTTANIEFDFGGILKSEPTLFRILHAYSAFKWEKSKFLIGQTWHPFWGGTIYPVVAGLNTGAPFQCFSRAPQVRYDIYAGKFSFGGALLYELQYTSKAFESSNYTTPNQAKRNGVLPEMTLVMEYKNKSFTAGGGLSYNRLKPRMTTTGTEGLYKSTEYIAGKGAMAYAKYTKNKFAIISKGYYGQNMNGITLLGGYGVASVDTKTGAETYTNYTNYTALVNALYGKKWQVGLLLGIGDNLGTTNALYNDGSNKAKTIGMMPNVKNISRVSPSLAFNYSKLSIVAEIERTAAAYGTGAMNFENGLFAQKHNTVNNRLNLMMMYFF
jgi:hypothetical protein